MPNLGLALYYHILNLALEMSEREEGVVESKERHTHCGDGAPQSQQVLLPSRFWISRS